MDSLGDILAALIAAAGGILLDRHLKRKDLQRDIYLNFIRMTDDIWPLIRDALSQGRSDSDIQSELERFMNESLPQIELVASRRVREQAKEYEEAWIRAVNDAIRAVRNNGKGAEAEVQRGRNTLVTEKDKLIKAMRAGLVQKPWQRRRV